MTSHLEKILGAYVSQPDPGTPPDVRSAVLVPVFETVGTLGVILIRRSERIGLHRGQMGFPGGISEEIDGGDLLRTALRETEEELGLPHDDVHVVGRLSARNTYTTKIMVTPFVGIIPFPYLFSPDPVEVRSVHPARLKDLAEAVYRGDNPFSLPPPVYPLDDQPVWGLSARILTELLEVLSPLLD